MSIEQKFIKTNVCHEEKIWKNVYPSGSYIYFLFSRCGCDECVTSSEQDSLRHSQARINAYRALTSPSLIALSSRDPLLTAFELSWELRRLSRMEQEFRFEYEVRIFTIWTSSYSSPTKKVIPRRNVVHRMLWTIRLLSKSLDQSWWGNFNNWSYE